MSSVNPYAAARTRRVSFLRLGNKSANSPGTRFFSEALAPGRSAAAASGNRQNVIDDRVCLASRLRRTAFGDFFGNNGAQARGQANNWGNRNLPRGRRRIPGRLV
ncbi:unnamed protein product [Amoebophrya sp. A25]|nr:unnamed protein product [Amoebophrya sp. A25]|eukprot:GSA25T00021061001.1